MPGDVQFPIECFLGLVGLARPSQTMGFPGFSGQQDRRVAMGLQNSFERLPAAGVPLLL